MYYVSSEEASSPKNGCRMTSQRRPGTYQARFSKDTSEEDLHLPAALYSYNGSARSRDGDVADCSSRGGTSAILVYCALRNFAKFTQNSGGPLLVHYLPMATWVDKGDIVRGK